MKKFIKNLILILSLYRDVVLCLLEIKLKKYN